LGSVFWDIGANVGLYSCYAAKKRKCKVIAFEPSVFNLELLSRNINLNNLIDNVSIVPLALTNEETKIAKFNMTTTDWGGALSTFCENYGDDGKELNKVFSYKTIGLSMDKLIQFRTIPQPTHIKMDVDGIEHLILSGGRYVLENVREILIEVNDEFLEQSSEVKRICSEAGLKFKGKRHAAMFDISPRFSKTFNQLWYRPE
jgi:FkbM family methyltransferase